MIQYETLKDKTLSNPVKYIKGGWPEKIIETDDLKKLFHRKDNLTNIDGSIIFGDRIIIPQIYRKRILKQLHRGHPGIENTKAIARSYVYWPSIDNDIKMIINNCQNCAPAAK